MKGFILANLVCFWIIIPKLATSRVSGSFEECARLHCSESSQEGDRSSQAPEAEGNRRKWEPVGRQAEVREEAGRRVVLAFF